MTQKFTRGGNILIKTFLFGILLGVAAAVGLLLAFPVVDQHRETSIISVAPNGGNVESFHINIPMDRIMIGAPSPAVELPAGLEWPTDDVFAGVSVELFKVRNARNAVIGVASRAAAEDETDSAIDWVVHLPARGSLFVDMAPTANEEGFRSGAIAAGSREFDELVGSVTERWISDTSDDVDAPDGRIELRAAYVSTTEPSE